MRSKRKSIAAIVLIMLGTFASQACRQTSPKSDTLDQLGWLLGEWERTDMKPNRTAFETWSRASSEKFVGTGVTLQEGDTVFVELLSLIFRDDKLYYVAEVAQNPEPTYFEVTQMTDSGFVCEAPQHDFPKKIVYALDGNQLTAVISGDGRSVPFHFMKTANPGD